MKGLRSTLLLLVVLLGLGGYIYFQGARPSEETVKTEKLFPGFDAMKLDEIRVKSKSGEVSTVRKTDGKWALVSPVNAPASETDVTAITSAIADMDVARVVEDDPKDVKEFGLDAPQLEVDFKGDGGKITGRLLVGVKTATGGNLYARREDQKRVVLIGPSGETVLNKSTFELREKHFLRLDRSKIDGIELQLGASYGALAKKGDDWTVTKPAIGRADNSATDGLLGRIDGAEMKSVVTSAPTADDLKKFGLDKPVATLTLQSGSDRRTVSLGSKADAATVYVRESTKPDVYTIDATTADDLKKSVDDYRRKELFDFRTFNATYVELTRAGLTVVLERVKSKDANTADTWHRVKPSPGDPDRSKVETMLAGLADIRATSFLGTRARTGLDSPTLTVVAKFDDGKKEERVTFGRFGADAFGARPDDLGASKIEASKLEEALTALDEIGK